MDVLKRSYDTRLPWHLRAVLLLLALISGLTLVYFVGGLLGTPLLNTPQTLGAQGDFIGGHLASILGSITLIVVIFTGYVQIQNERKFRIRELFLSGIAAISSYEAQKPGTEQAMRLLDYFAQVAFQLGDNELLLILNTVITKEIRSNLEAIEAANRREYPNAIAAKKKIGEILAAHYKALHDSEPRPAA